MLFLFLLTTTIIATVDVEMLPFALGVSLVLPKVTLLCSLCVLVLSHQKVHRVNRK